jgi:hypothetical protein
MLFVPSEMSIGGIYFPPLLLAAILGVVAASMTQKWMDQSGFAEAFANPSLVFLSLSTIYTVLLTLTVLPT